MVIENQSITLIDEKYLSQSEVLKLSNCIIKCIDLIGCFELNTEMIIDNCIIEELNIHSCWFVKGLKMRRCIVNSYIDYQMGGHNDAPLVFDQNIFIDFFNFFDCEFNAPIVFTNNIVMKGANLLGNIGEGFENRFNNGWEANNNLGDINLNEVI
ncbi:hypothetical protein FAZ15_22015 [Sphingobacterium olei]|uniref:Pentapeptide repeat-containing protein n=1 Tax=Sphingobacterium olei TaxID=2571155 RepID=A0A4U0N837_9SPHI|nr:hypothetical protein [Sphingobacterium olei]TJZ49900.1 hypothetical protein FAZ15_22015 [Sphingobacterium olei]